MTIQERLPQALVDYLLCRFIRACGEVHGRKRLQKMVFLAGGQGMPLFHDYFFHLPGPYSPGLASTLDRLVERGLLVEESERVDPSDPERVQYCYHVSDLGNRELADFEADPDAGPFVKVGAQLEKRFLALRDRSVPQLVLAATIVYWRRFGYQVDAAARITADLQRSSSQGQELEQATALARESMAETSG